MTVTTMAANNRTLDLKVWLDKADIARQFAEVIADSAFIPMSYRLASGGRLLPRDAVVANATSAILLGDSLGVDPLTALQNIFIINGKPGLYTNFKVGLLQRDFDIITVKRDPEICIVKGRKKGSFAEIPWTEVKITIEMAEKAEWTRNSQYKKIPADMLYARAAGRLCDMLGADVLHGLATVEDLHDYDEDGDYNKIVDSSLAVQPYDKGGVTARPMITVDGPTANATTGGARIQEMIQRGENAPAPAITPTERVSRNPQTAEAVSAPVPEKENTDVSLDRAVEIAARQRAQGRTDTDTAVTAADTWARTAEQFRNGAGEITVEEVENDPQLIDWTTGEVHDDGPAAVLEDMKEESEDEEAKAVLTANMRRAAEKREDVQEPEGWNDGPSTISASTWGSINSLFNAAHKINGEGSRAARYRVIEHITGKLITKGSDLTSNEGEAVYRWLQEKSPGDVQRIAWGEEKTDG